MDPVSLVIRLPVSPSPFIRKKMFQILKNQICLSFSERLFRGCFHMEAAASTSKAAFTLKPQL